jgi:hypothetical protein
MRRPATALDPAWTNPSGAISGLRSSTVSKIKIFGLGSCRPQAQSIAADRGVAPAQLDEHEFDDGEHKALPLKSGRGAGVQRTWV